MMRHRTVVLAVALSSAAVLVVVGGAVPVATAQGSRDQGRSAETVLTATALTATASSPDAPARPPRRRPRSFFPPGPASPLSPQIDNYYYRLQHGACGQVRDATAGLGSDEPAVALFAAAADVCLGVKSRSHHIDWTAVAAAFDASASLDDCLSLSARLALGRALKAHATHPTARPSFGKVPAGTACQPTVTMAVLLRDASGSVTSLVLLGQRLFEASKVFLDGSWHAASSDNAAQGTDCARVDVAGTGDLAEGAQLVVQVKGNGYTTTPTRWLLGAPVDQGTFEDNLDTDACVVDSGSP